MAIRLGKGDLCGITLREEESYGVLDTSVTTKTHAGVMSTLSAPDNITYGDVMDCGSRLKANPYIDKRDPTAKVKFKVGKDVNWTTWLNWIIGGTTMTSGNPSSKRMICKVASGKAEEFEGAMVNKLTITSTEIGAPLEFEAEIYARKHTQTGITNCASISTQSPLRVKDHWHWDGLDDDHIIRSGKWTLSIDQKLQKVAGADGDITLASGEEPYLGDDPEVTLEITLPALSSTPFDAMRLSNTITKELASIIIGSYLLNLVDLHLTGNLPDRQSGQYEDKLVFKAKSVYYEEVTQ